MGSVIAIVATVVYALALPVIVEARHFLSMFWDFLVAFQRLFIEFAERWLSPIFAKLARLIHLESVQKLYEDIKKGEMSPEQCVKAFLSRSSKLGRFFILGLSVGVAYWLSEVLFQPFQILVEDSIGLPAKEMHEVYPIAYVLIVRFSFFVSMVFVYYAGTYTLSFLVWIFNKVSWAAPAKEEVAAPKTKSQVRTRQRRDDGIRVSPDEVD